MIMSKSRRLVYSVGVNDSNYVTQRVGWKCPFYVRWKTMLKRCYSSRYKKINPTYKDCSVCDEWLTFSNFKDWMIKQDWKDKVLDKDILVQGNKIYSPETCLFVSLLINNLILTRKASRGKSPQGVSFDGKRNEFRVQQSINGVTKFIGYFKCEKMASDAYKKEKYKRIKEVARTVGEPLKSALLAYKIKD